MAAEPTDSEIKAAFLYNFTKFVEWPPQSFPSADDPIVIGVLGAAQFAAVLERLVKDRKVNGHVITVRRIDTTQDAKSAHLLFVATEEDTHFARLLPSLQGTPILTVGESPAFAKAGGIITFVEEDSKVRFEINAAAAEQAGLKISAQLLKLARAPSGGS